MKAFIRLFEDLEFVVNDLVIGLKLGIKSLITYKN